MGKGVFVIRGSGSPNNILISAYNVPYGADYPAYPNVTNPPLIYEQSYGPSTIYISDFDDASSIATFSPAMSTDSTETLKSPVDSESGIDKLEAHQTLSVHSAYDVPAASQAIAISRSSSIHRSSDGHTPGQESSTKMASLPLRMATPFKSIDNTTPHPLCFPYMDDASSVSELEVDERDRIARLNAEYNSALSTNYSRRNSISSHAVGNTNDLRQAPSASSRHTSSNQAGFSRLTSCRPLHPDLHFPPRVSGNANGASATFPTYASLDGSPPSVERVPSHLPLAIEDIPRISANAFSEQSHSLPAAGSRRDSTLDSSNSSRSWNQRAPIAYPTKNSPTISSSSYSAHVKDSGDAQIAFPDQTWVNNEVEQRKNRIYAVGAPSGLSQDRNIPEKKTLNVITNSGQDDDTRLRNDDKHIKTQYIYQDTTSSPPSDNSRAHKNSSASQRSHSSPQRQIPQPSEVDERGRAAVGAILRNDTRTPAPQQRDRNLIEQELVRHSPSSKHLSASQPAPDSPSRTFTEVRSGAQPRENDVSKQQGTTISSDITHRNVYNGDIVPNSTSANRSHMLDAAQQRFSRSSRQSTTASTQDPTYHDAKHVPDYEREIEKELDKDRHSRNGSTPQRLSSSRATESTPESVRKTVDSYSEREDDRQRLTVNVHVKPSYLPREGETALHNQPEVPRVTAKAGSTYDFSKSDSANKTTKIRDETNLFPTPPDNRKPHSHNIQHPSLPPSWAQSGTPRSSGSDERKPSAGVRIGSTQNDKHSSPLTIKTDVESYQTTAAAPLPVEPHRRYSDGDQATPPIHPSFSGRSSAPLARSVRWTENLIAPSPVLAPPKRKGWFNRRGQVVFSFKIHPYFH